MAKSRLDHEPKFVAVARKFLYGQWTKTMTEFEEVTAIADLIEAQWTEALTLAGKEQCRYCDGKIGLGVQRYTIERVGDVFVHYGFSEAGVGIFSAHCEAQKIQNLLFQLPINNFIDKPKKRG